MRLALTRHNTKKGFTIVELLVVIVVIGILATISIVSYGSWRHSSLSSKVKSDLVSVAAAMDSARTFTNSFPLSLPSTFVASSGVNLNLQSSDGKSYCIDGVSSEDATIQFYMASESSSKGALSGTCLTRPSILIPAVPTNLATTTVTGVSVGLTWDASANAISYTAQCASDSGFVMGLKSSSVSTSPTTVTGLTLGSSYYCRVRATNANGYSAWSATVNVITSSS
jgi:type IV pilus assembly protein PilA